jgi:DNA-binding NarL/FixJ family response regulator
VPVSEHQTSSPTVAVVASSDTVRRRLVASLSVAGIDVTSASAELGDVLAEMPANVLVIYVSSRGGSDPTLRSVQRRDAQLPIVCVLARPAWKGARALLRDGASGVVAEDETDVALPAAVRSAYVGQITLPSRLRMQIAQPVLSVREKQMLAMVVMGFSNPEISGKLHVAESTVKSHLSSAFAKLGVRSRNEATALILDPATGLGTGILEISGTARHGASQMVPASAA